MPVICIKTLPFKKKPDIPAILKKLNTRVAGVINYEARHIWSYWQFIEPGNYAVGELTSPVTTHDSHSPIVSVLSFEGKKRDEIEKMLKTIAEVLTAELDIDPGNIFITYSEVSSGCVFDGGEIVFKK
jgi:hypothetical protein